MTLPCKAKDFFLSTINEVDDKYNLERHVPEAEQWAQKLLACFLGVYSDVVITAIWLHDISHYCCGNLDHAVISEDMARIFLASNSIDCGTSDRICHCIRAHRCNDILPQTLEAKIVAFADSASHMTDGMYIDMIKQYGYDRTRAKLERDHRDTVRFTEIPISITPLYEAWVKYLTAYSNIYHQ